MKNINYKLLITAFTLIVVATSCDDRLDVQPAQSISADVALGTSDDVQAALVGAYDELGNSDTWGGDWLMHADLLADDGELFWNGSFIGPRQIFNKAILTDNTEVREIWMETYETINRVNNVLAVLDIVDAGDKDRIEGEALFIRGVCHYYLVQFFGKDINDGTAASNPGVPIITTPTSSIDASSNVSRATVAAVYTQVLADLERAAALLPGSNGFFATSHAANAMLARIYLQQGRNAEAATAANSVISSGNFALASTYANVFNQSNNTVEDIFALQVTDQDGNNNLNTFYAPSENGGRGDIDISPAHEALYDPADDRLNLFYTDNASSRRTGKWTNGIDDNVNAIRLAEMYLIRAEANFQAGSATGAFPVADINTIRARVNLPALGSVTLADIMLERKLELAFEGFGLADIRRQQLTLGNGFSYSDNAMVFPIPQREIDTNTSLTQNPGY